MDNMNIVTISIEEYFDLRSKAEANAFLMREFGEIDARLRDLDQKYYDLKYMLEQKRV